MSRLMEVGKIHYLLAIVLVNKVDFSWYLTSCKVWGMRISSSCGFECWWRDFNHIRFWIRGGLIWASSVPSLDFYLTQEKTGKANFARLSLCIRKKLFLGMGGGGGGGFKGILFGSLLQKPFNSDPSCLKAKCIQISTLFRTLNSEVEYFFLTLKIP